MKYRTTQKEIRRGYDKVICVGYCNLQTLLSMEEPCAYTAGRDGWGADVYDFNSVAITTGYSPFGNVKPSYEKQKEYENKARKLEEEYRYCFDYKEKKEVFRKLIDEFITEVC